MKKVICLILALCCVLALAACADATPHSQKSDSDGSSDSKETVQLSREQKAENSFKAFLEAQNVEEAAQYFETDSDEQLRKTMEYYGQYDLTVEMDYLGKIDDADAFKCHIMLQDGSTLNTSFIFGKEQDDGYVFCEKEAYLTEIREKVLCKTCNASGVVYSGGTVCGICAGTGWQYIPNAYYDPGTQMWMGQNQACSGCAGMGYFNRQSLPCTDCHGIGLILD